jgi:CheY-like chemotaxis protein
MLKRSDEMHVRRGSETTLLVEDETAVREIIALLLKRLGYRVQEASSGEDGLRLAQGSQEIAHGRRSLG